jgi:hypothetical protein
MSDDPSRVHASPRTNTPAGKSISFRYGFVAVGSTIQMDPAWAPGSTTAASRLPSGDHPTRPLPIHGASGPSSGLDVTR